MKMRPPERIPAKPRRHTMSNSTRNKIGSAWSIVLLLIVALNGRFVQANEHPNVVFVITDDQGYGDLSCHGNPILQTPHLDRLWGQSVRLTDFHVSPTCAPTRGALMSGHYTNRAGPWHTIMGRSMLYEGEKTFGEVFADNGYATGMFGKWHLGDNYPFRPEDRGFQEVVRHGGGGVGQTPDNWDNAYFDDTYFHNGRPQKYTGFCTDVYFQEAKRFIDESTRAGKPFLAYISTNAPHGPFHCPDRYWKPYERKVTRPQEAVFFGMIANIDENVGKMRQFLQDRGLADNTIFIFMTDNGSATGFNVFNSGMRGHKGSEYEGGHRVPFFVHWPKGGLTGGLDVERLCGHIDILPTLIDLCGLGSVTHYQFDGRSLFPLLHNPQGPWPKRTIVTDSQRVRDPIKWRKCSTMTDRWRLINGTELYDIQADPGQKQDVAQQYPQVVTTLRADYEAWWADISPVFAKDARIIVGHPSENPSRLTSHDWLTYDGTTPWNQGQIRRAQQGLGHWAIKVATAGRYRITLRRWPHATATAISEGLPRGAAVPGLTAFRETLGKGLAAQRAGIRIGGIEREEAVQAGDQGVSFELSLESGEVDFLAYFILKEGKKVGAYYADVKKL